MENKFAVIWCTMYCSIKLYMYVINLFRNKHECKSVSNFRDRNKNIYLYTYIQTIGFSLSCWFIYNSHLSSHKEIHYHTGIFYTPSKHIHHIGTIYIYIYIYRYLFHIYSFFHHFSVEEIEIGFAPINNHLNSLRLSQWKHHT